MNHRITPSEKAVMDWIGQHGPATDLEILRGLEYAYSKSIRTIVTGLVHRGFLDVHGVKTDTVTFKPGCRVVGLPRTTLIPQTGLL